MAPGTEGERADRDDDRRQDVSGHRPWSEVRDARLARMRPEDRDELDAFLATALRTRTFARAYYRAAASMPVPLCIDGREYARRRQARRRRGR